MSITTGNTTLVFMFAAADTPAQSPALLSQLQCGRHLPRLSTDFSDLTGGRPSDILSGMSLVAAHLSGLAITASRPPAPSARTVAELPSK